MNLKLNCDSRRNIIKITTTKKDAYTELCSKQKTKATNTTMIYSQKQKRRLKKFVTGAENWVEISKSLKN